MIKILTAINNPILNEELKSEEGVKIVCKDIQYKEGILEILENEIEIDYLIIDEKLPGEIELTKLIEEIYEKNEKIKIIITIKKDNKKNNILKNDKIITIFYDNKINLNKLKNYKKNQKISYEEKEEKNKINNLKRFKKTENKFNDFKIIKKLKNKINNFKIIKKIRNKIINFKVIKKFKSKIKKLEITNKIKNYKTKIIKNKETNFRNNGTKKITILGESKIGKSIMIINLALFLKTKNYKILIVDLNSENPSIYTIFGCKKFNKKSTKVKTKIKNRCQNIKGKFKQKYLNEKIIENMIIKINKNINLISYNKLLNFNILKKIEKKYNYIFIEIYSEKNIKINKKIIFDSDEKILLIKPNLLGIKNCKKIIEKNQLNKINNFKIVINNYNKYSINEEIIKNIYLENKIIGKIKYKKEYEYFINKNYKGKQIRDKLYRKEIKKIINNII